MLVGILLSFPSHLETNPDNPCPVIEIECADSEQAGKRITFRAIITGGPIEIKPTYKWKISAGRIIKGQGTNTIVVDTRGAKAESIKAYVKASGYNKACFVELGCSVPLLRN